MSEENRKLMDTSRADPQCYMCNADKLDTFSCSNCMMQHQLDRLSELEKSDKFNWIKLFQETCFNDKGESKISELEKKVKLQSIVNSNFIEKIAELKEQFYGKVDMFENWLIKIEGVLRDLLAEIFIFTYPDNPEEKKKVEIQKYRELLAKLDGGKTEKKEVHDCVECKVQKTYDHTGTLVCDLECEDSGGVYEGMITGEQQIAMEQHEGEKPPEPKCDKCGGYLLSGFKDEPREDDVHRYPMLLNPYLKLTRELGYDIVKREDLKELYEIGHIAPYNPVREKFLARIKEEYKL